MASHFTATAVNVGNVLAFAARPTRCVGNLVVNGGFEARLANWTICNGGIVRGREPHAGRRAAGLGTRLRNRRRASLEQDIPIPQEAFPQFFQLVFHVAGRWRSPASVVVTVSWLDREGRVLGTAARAFIRRWAIGNGSRGAWTTYHLVTNQPPEEAVGARVRFLKLRGRIRRNFLVVDDVVLSQVATGCFVNG